MKKSLKFLIFPILIINLFFAFNYNVKADLESNPDAAYDTHTISCGSAKGIPRAVAIMSRNAVKVLKLLVPIVLIVLGIIDMFRASSSDDDKQMKEATKRFARRVIAAVLVFFVVSLVQLIVNLIAKSAEESGGNETTATTAQNIASCISCFISDKDSCKDDNYLRGY